jgi:FKBP-type peptidyl-prolyl cis-trans isomerase FklB
MICAVALCFCLVLLAASHSLASDIVLKEAKDRTTYSLGYQIGEDLKKQDVDFDRTAFQRGVEDALSDTKPYFSDEEIRATLVELKKKIVAQDKARQSDRRATAQSNKVGNKEKYAGEGRDFLTANAKNEGVVVLHSGLQYKVLTEGSGKKPGLHDNVIVNYRGTLVDGTEFGSSYGKDKPEKRRVDALIPGMKEALQLMGEGARWRIFVPADLAYGEKGPLADRTVIIDVELVSVESSK